MPYTTDAAAKLCVECHYRDASVHPFGCKQARSVVDGLSATAHSMRSDPDMCGTDGKWFVPEGWREDRV